MAAESEDRAGTGPAGLPHVDVSAACSSCGQVCDAEALRKQLFVCDCGHHFRMTAAAWVALLADEGSWRERWADLQPVDFLRWQEPVPYDELVSRANRRGHDEAVRVGTCRIGGHQVWLGVFDFAFMGGTLGVVAGERLTRGMEQAAASRLPFVTVTASGGARMQEGTLALMQMAKVNALVGLLQDVGVPYFSILTDPTFGGTSASLALVADINLAEPGCSIGFTGARVIRQATHTDLPPDFQTAEFQLERGQVDMVVSRLDLRARLVELLQLYRDATALRSRVRRSRPRGPAGRQAGRSWPRAAQEADDAPRGWPLVTLARHPERPYAKDYIQRWADRFVEVHGDRLVGDDHALVGGIGRWNGVPTMFLGQQKARTFAERVRCNFGMMHPEGYRKAMRLARQAARFGFPIVVLLDTPGAYPGAGAEERGMAGAIASAITEWFRIGTPVVAAVIGEGGSGGALGLGVADRVLMMEHAIYSVASPEAAASIVWRDSAKKEAAAEQFRLSAADMVRLGVADTVVPEPPGGAHTDPNMAAELLGAAVQETLRELIDAPAEELLANRHRRFRGMGNQMLDRGPRLETAGTTAATATPAGEG